MRIALNSGAYQTRSVIASAQRCVNLYPQVSARESFMMIPQPEASALVTHYPTPGLTRLAQATSNGWRGLYRANNGDLYGVCGSTVYAVGANWSLTALGTIADGTTPVSMADNGTTLVLVDGTSAGYTIDLASDAFAVLSDPTGSFVGADRVDYIDTFFVFNKPGTQAFYSSLSNSVTFDPLYIANKTGFGDKLVTLAVQRREIWLFGERTTEIWYNAGTAQFPYQIVAGTFINHGCVAKYSVARQDQFIYWLGQDEQGQGIVFAGNNYQADRISTHAIENEIQSYQTISDAEGYIHQVEGNTFYVLNFPSADKTWVYDAANNLWHQRMWQDGIGGEHRHRGRCGAFANGRFVVGDWQNGNLYAYDLNNFTDDGQPIRRIRAFPHVDNELKRTVHRQFIADMQTGGATDPAIDPQISLRWSDDRGASWGNYVTQSMGKVGQGLVNLQWQRLGMARDRVYELSWDGACLTALNGANIEVIPAPR